MYILRSALTWKNQSFKNLGLTNRIFSQRHMDAVKLKREDYLRNRFLQTRHFFKGYTKDYPRFHEPLPQQNVFSLVAVNISCKESKIGLTWTLNNKLDKGKKHSYLVQLSAQHEILLWYEHAWDLPVNISNQSNFTYLSFLKLECKKIHFQTLTVLNCRTASDW